MNKKLLLSAIATGCLIATSCIQANTDSNMLQSEIGNFNKSVQGSSNILVNSILNSRAEYTIKDKGYELFRKCNIVRAFYCLWMFLCSKSIKQS